MRRKIILAVIAVLVGFLFWFLNHPFRNMKATTPLKALINLLIYTDAFGVPHVFAQNEEDLFYAAGYYAARDRLFQMSIVNFSVRGELSSALGDELIDSDIYQELGGFMTSKKTCRRTRPTNSSAYKRFLCWY